MTEIVDLTIYVDAASETAHLPKFQRREAAEAVTTKIYGMVVEWFAGKSYKAEIAEIPRIDTVTITCSEEIARAFNKAVKEKVIPNISRLICSNLNVLKEIIEVKLAVPPFTWSEGEQLKKQNQGGIILH